MKVFVFCESKNSHLKNLEFFLNIVDESSLWSNGLFSFYLIYFNSYFNLSIDFLLTSFWNCIYNSKQDHSATYSWSVYKLFDIYEVNSFSINNRKVTSNVNSCYIDAPKMRELKSSASTN